MTGTDLPEVYLQELPADHPLRNRPLIEIGAYYQLTTKGAMWAEIKPTFGIANCTFNQLGEVWIKHHIWKATKP